MEESSIYSVFFPFVRSLLSNPTLTVSTRFLSDWFILMGILYSSRRSAGQLRQDDIDDAVGDAVGYAVGDAVGDAVDIAVSD